MTYEEMGAALKSEREKRNLNIEDVANELKISPRQLRALESGDMDALPHPAYARGFLRSYANWLGLNSEELRNSVAESPAATPFREKDPEQEELHIDMDPAPKKRGKGVYALVFLCLVGAGIYYAWHSGALSQLEWPGKDESSAQLQSADSYIAAKEAEENSGQPADGNGDASVPPSPAPAYEPEPVKEEGVGLPPIGQASTPSGENDAPAENAQAEKIPGQHKLIITATEECWVHSNADKTDTRQFSLRKGDTFALTFANSLELKLGNAGGVRLRYDGEDLPAPGTSGQVRTISFPPKNNS